VVVAPEIARESSDGQTTVPRCLGIQQLLYTAPPLLNAIKNKIENGSK